jgi:hypothetical protein
MFQYFLVTEYLKNTQIISFKISISSHGTNAEFVFKLEKFITLLKPFQIGKLWNCDCPVLFIMTLSTNISFLW